jgi:hypothetical protein
MPSYPYTPGAPKPGVGGWLLVLCLLWLIGQPLNLAWAASSGLDSIVIRGASAAAVLLARIAVTAFGIAAGIALLRRQPSAVTLATLALIASTAMYLFVLFTHYLPSNRMPGDEFVYAAGTLVYCAGWIAYLSRSTRVRNTFHGN